MQVRLKKLILNEFLVIDRSLRRSRNPFKIKNKNIDADKSLISVVCMEVNVELIKITLDIKAANTAQKTEPIAQRPPRILVSLEFSFLNVF